LKGESDKLLTEFQSINLKAQAKQQKKSALDLKEEQESIDDINTKVLAQKSSISMGGAAGVFLITSGAVFAGFLAYQKM
jgi:hypothetical protein